jgi:hypothetical protein
MKDALSVVCSVIAIKFAPLSFSSYSFGHNFMVYYLLVIWHVCSQRNQNYRYVQIIGI